MGDLGLHGFLHFLQNPRHDPYDVGPVYRQQFLQIVRIAICNAHAFVEVAEAKRALQNMRQRQDRESLVGGIGRDARQAAPQIGHDITVRKHHAFGRASGAGSIDNGRQIVRRRGQRFGADTAQRRLVEYGCLGDDPRQGSVDAGRLFHGHDGFQLRQFRRRFR